MNVILFGFIKKQGGNQPLLSMGNSLKHKVSTFAIEILKNVFIYGFIQIFC